MRKALLTLGMLALLASPVHAQCPGDPTGGSPAIRQLVLDTGRTISPTSPDAMQQMVQAVRAAGHASTVVDNHGPSDHKAWVDGEAWTWLSTDPVRCPTTTWSPYVQAAYDGQGMLACGIPLSAHLPCPGEDATVPPVTPSPLPPAFDQHDVLVQLTDIQARLDALKAQSDANTEKLAQQIDQVVKNAEKSTAPLILKILSLGVVR